MAVYNRENIEYGTALDSVIREGEWLGDEPVRAEKDKHFHTQTTASQWNL